VSDPISRERSARRGILTFFVIAVTIAGCMFTFKLYSFLQTIQRDELAGFAFDPIVIYGIVAAGFGCLLMWAFLSGQFKQIEEPKHAMLKRALEQEAAEGYTPLEDRV
jgi:hypothetical protein